MAITPAGRGPEVLAVYSLFLGLTTLTVGLRAYCRLRIQRAFGWDDWFAVLAWVGLVILIYCRRDMIMLTGDRFSLFYMQHSPLLVSTMAPVST